MFIYFDCFADSSILTQKIYFGKKSLTLIYIYDRMISNGDRCFHNRKMSNEMIEKKVLENGKKEVKIIFEDEYFFACDKPNGMMIHPDGRSGESTFVDWVKEYWEGEYAKKSFFQKILTFKTLESFLKEKENIGKPHTLDSGRYFARWGIVNRLDKETSGIVIVAKNEFAYFKLAKQFESRLAEKEYVALCLGEEKKVLENGKIDISLSRHKKDPRLWVIGENTGERNSKRDASTSYSLEKKSGNFFLMHFFPHTGRTHQIRLHARHLGLPILGDEKYGISGLLNIYNTDTISNLQKEISENILEEDRNSRLMLHAYKMKIKHPKTKEEMSLSTDYPKDFQNFF